jgi:hypothetical protein
LARTFVSPCFGGEPKVKVVTLDVVQKQLDVDDPTINKLHCLTNIVINSRNITYINMIKYLLFNPHTYDLFATNYLLPILFIAYLID